MQILVIISRVIIIKYVSMTLNFTKLGFTATYCIVHMNHNPKYHSACTMHHESKPL